MLLPRRATILSRSAAARGTLAAVTSFGDRLNLALTLARKTRRDLAVHLQISEQAVGQVINGQTTMLTAENAARAARFLECSTYWLCTGEDGPHQVAERLAPPYLRWPFQAVSYERIARLNAMQRDMLEALMLKAMAEFPGGGASSQV